MVPRDTHDGKVGWYFQFKAFSGCSRFTTSRAGSGFWSGPEPGYGRVRRVSLLTAGCDAIVVLFELEALEGPKRMNTFLSADGDIGLQ